MQFSTWVLGTSGEMLDGYGVVDRLDTASSYMVQMVSLQCGSISRSTRMAPLSSHTFMEIGTVEPSVLY
jgi:hypothetical protein